MTQMESRTSQVGIDEQHRCAIEIQADTDSALVAHSTTNKACGNCRLRRSCWRIISDRGQDVELVDT